jgi:DNA-binding protein H-NS
MSSDLDRLAKMKLRKAAQLERERQEAEKLRKTEIKIRQAERALATRRAMLIGETIRDAKLSHEEKAVICGIMSRRESKPADWDKVSDFTVHLVRETPSLRPAAAEFSRTGK